MALKITKEMLNEGQKHALVKVVAWYRSRIGKDRYNTKPYFFLAGYAGTGKTTVASLAVESCVLPHQAVYIAPTGKAASRLRKKGCKGAMTFHQFLYVLATDGSEDEDSDLEFSIRGALKGERPKLIVLDEGSMVSEEQIKDLLSLGIPVLVLGDTGQVEPVNGSPYFVEGKEDVLLTDIERNKGNIVRASFFVRTGNRLPAREYEDVKVYNRRPTVADYFDHAGEDSIILCSYNNTRQKVNAMIRAKFGRTGPMPEIGEKVICTFNQREYDVMNGEVFILQEMKRCPDSQLSPGEDPEFVKLAILRDPEDGEIRQAKMNLSCFLGIDEKERNKSMKSQGGFDFGYALTIHKSQGSEWPRVLLVEEYMKSCPYRKLIYTGITRAKSHLTMFRDQKM